MQSKTVGKSLMLINHKFTETESVDRTIISMYVKIYNCLNKILKNNAT